MYRKETRKDDLYIFQNTLLELVSSIGSNFNPYDRYTYVISINSRVEVW